MGIFYEKLLGQNVNAYRYLYMSVSVWQTCKGAISAK